MIMEFESYASSSRGNLYRVRDGEGASLLIECGLPPARIRAALEYRLSDLSACLLTHAHLDHARGASDVMGAGVDLYCTGETAEALKLKGHRLHLVKPLEQFQAGRFSVCPFEAQHDCPGAVGFLIQSGDDKLLFAIDTYFIYYQFRNLTHICVECNYSEGTISPEMTPQAIHRLAVAHFSLERVLGFLASADLSACREIHLLHLSDRNSDEALFKRRVAQLTGLPVFVANA